MSQPGRNDPCHCGSGRKYKNCHWNEDREANRERAVADRRRREALEAVGAPSEEEMRSMYLEMTGRPLPADRIQDRVRSSLTELWRQQRLAASAREQLDAHRQAIADRLEADADAFETLASGLVRELDLDRFELTRSNARKARGQLGEMPETPAERRAYATEAVRMTLETDDRESFRDGLLSFLPDLVADERWDEAWVLERCAERALDPEAEACAFLEDVVARSVT